MESQSRAIMKKFFVVNLALVVVVACGMVCREDSTADIATLGMEQSVGSKANAKGGSGSSSSIESEWEQEDFKAHLQAHANYGKFFRSIVEDLNDICEIFDEYIFGDDIMGQALFADVNNWVASDVSFDQGYDY